MQFKFALELRGKCYQSGIVWTRGNLTKPYLVTFYKEFHTKDSATTECCSNLIGNALGLFQRGRSHWLRLPAFHIVARVLTMSDWVAVRRFDFAGFWVFGTNSQ